MQRPNRLAWALLLCACQASEPPPDTAEAPSQATEPAPIAPEAATPSVQHEITEGETLWDIARAYDLRIEDILAANDLREEDAKRLRAGSFLQIPGRERAVDVETAADRARLRQALPALSDGVYHQLERGESLWVLSRQYDVPIEAILERNQLDDESASDLREGQTLIIPGVDKQQAERAAKVAEHAPKGVQHTLVAGETIWDLAHAFGVGAGEIMTANGLSEDEVRSLREGQQILIPGVQTDKKGRVSHGTSARKRRADAVAKRLGLGTRKVAKELLRGKVKPAWIAAAGGKDALPGTLRWPVTKGWYVRGFGSGEGGYHQAVDIMGKIGWNVRAAAPGIVAYSGDEVRGYGNVVMVIHPGGWVTMYAHNSVNFVAAGEQVPRGGILAEVGSTGISRGPHVHFELIHRNQNCDPAALFRPGIRHRRDNRREVAPLRWTDPDARPRAIRCGRRRRHPRSRWVIHESEEVQREDDDQNP